MQRLHRIVHIESDLQTDLEVPNIPPKGGKHEGINRDRAMLPGTH